MPSIAIDSDIDYIEHSQGKKINIGTLYKREKIPKFYLLHKFSFFPKLISAGVDNLGNGGETTMPIYGYSCTIRMGKASSISLTLGSIYT